MEIIYGVYMTWFGELMGFEDDSCGYGETQKKIICDYKKHTIKSKINNKDYYYGKLELPSLKELRERTYRPCCGKLQCEEIHADVKNLIADPKNKNSLFQVASQFNLLEMASEEITPEDGVSIYEYDHTQGPACAIACGAGTIYRNYFVKLNGQIGQRKDKQINCLSDLMNFLNIDDKEYFRNGYFLPNRKTLEFINFCLENLKDIEPLKNFLRVGVQWDTEVTISNQTTNGVGHRVSQIFCSAVPASYSSLSKNLWERFARFILDVEYEATFRAALINQKRTGNNKLFLTLLGGGAFGNDEKWIFEAIERNLKKFANCDLNVYLVIYSG